MYAMILQKFYERKAQELLDKSGITLNGDEPWDIKVNDSSVIRDAILFGSLGFGDGYVSGKWDVKSIDQCIEKILMARPNPTFNLVDLAQNVRNALINTQAGRRAFQVAHKHYDLGNDMYEYMLGESMGYSSGIYLKASDSLEDAQYNKFDALCKKLDFKKGMKVLEIGAGWGTFARHAAKNYGVEVIGLTVSKEQKKFAERRCKGLPVKFLLLDYRDLDERFNEQFDRVVSIEMIEAVGKKNFKSYFATIERVMKSSGMFGLQAIMGKGEVDTFISTRIFPNGQLPSLADIGKHTNGLLQVKGWDSFGQDYVKTLFAWDANFRKHWKSISKLKNAAGEEIYDEQFYRMWRYYLMCCVATFRSGMNDVVQIVMTKQPL